MSSDSDFYDCMTLYTRYITRQTVTRVQDDSVTCLDVGSSSDRVVVAGNGGSDLQGPCWAAITHALEKLTPVGVREKRVAAVDARRGVAQHQLLAQAICDGNGPCRPLYLHRIAPPPQPCRHCEVLQEQLRSKAQCWMRSSIICKLLLHMQDVWPKQRKTMLLCNIIINDQKTVSQSLEGVPRRCAEFHMRVDPRELGGSNTWRISVSTGPRRISMGAGPVGMNTP